PQRPVDGQGHFINVSRRAPDAVRLPRRSGEAEPAATGRIDAGVDGEPFFDEKVQGPQALPGDRKTGRPISAHRSAGQVLQDVPRSPDVLTKFLRRLLINPAVPVTVTANFMTGALNGPDQLGMPIGHPAQNEEGA